MNYENPLHETGNSSGPHLHFEGTLPPFNINEQPTQLADMQRRVKEINEANGWFESDRSFGDDIALLHSEVSEAFEAWRQWKTRDTTRELCQKGKDITIPKLQFPGGIDPGLNAESLTYVNADHSDHVCKPEGVGSELADILVRILDTCERYGIDLEYEFERKLKHNSTRGHRHGGKHV